VEFPEMIESVLPNLGLDTIEPAIKCGTQFVKLFSGIAIPLLPHPGSFSLLGVWCAHHASSFPPDNATSSYQRYGTPCWQIPYHLSRSGHPVFQRYRQACANATPAVLS